VSAASPSSGPLDTAGSGVAAPRFQGVLDQFVGVVACVRLHWIPRPTRSVARSARHRWKPPLRSSCWSLPHIRELHATTIKEPALPFLQATQAVGCDKRQHREEIIEGEIERRERDERRRPGISLTLPPRGQVPCAGAGTLESGLYASPTRVEVAASTNSRVMASKLRQFLVDVSPLPRWRALS
jgi:hypothetical protein